MKKKWPENLTKEYVEAVRFFITTVDNFKNDWRKKAKKYEEPTGADAGEISDAEADLSDCLDRFFN